jgi:hypothetical protein
VGTHQITGRNILISPLIFTISSTSLWRIESYSNGSSTKVIISGKPNPGNMSVYRWSWQTGAIEYAHDVSSSVPAGIPAYIRVHPDFSTLVMFSYPSKVVLLNVSIPKKLFEGSKGSENFGSLSKNRIGVVYITQFML